MVLTCIYWKIGKHFNNSVEACTYFDICIVGRFQRFHVVCMHGMCVVSEKLSTCACWFQASLLCFNSVSL